MMEVSLHFPCLKSILINKKLNSRLLTIKLFPTHQIILKSQQFTLFKVLLSTKIMESLIKNCFKSILRDSKNLSNIKTFSADSKINPNLSKVFNQMNLLKKIQKNKQKNQKFLFQISKKRCKNRF